MAGPKKILEYSVECPVCGRSMKVEDYLYEVPRIGKVIISTGRCSYCGYRWSDVRLAEPRKPRKIIYRVEKPGDENALIVRASSASRPCPEARVW
jgi:zinc finger protein